MAVDLTMCWLIHVTGVLYQQDLFDYAAAVLHICEQNVSSEDTVDKLSEIESRITHRFRQANASGVGPIVGSALYGMFMALLCTMLLVVTPNLGWALRFECILYLVMGLTIQFAVIRQLTAVAETHEYDVLRELNNPRTISQSRGLIGELLLTHLQSLGWGFRFGGSLIDNRMLSSSFGGLIVAAIAAIGQMVLGHVPGM